MQPLDVDDAEISTAFGAEIHSQNLLTLPPTELNGNLDDFPVSNQSKIAQFWALLKSSRKLQILLAVTAAIVVLVGLAAGLATQPRNSTLATPAKMERFASAQELRNWVSAGWREGFGRVFWFPFWGRRWSACGGPIYMMAEADSASASSQSRNEYSSTNNQVDGVDEGDIVKTDGSYIYSLLDEQLDRKDEWNNSLCEQQIVISRAYPASEAQIVHRIRFDQSSASFEARELQLDTSSSTLIVLGTRNWTFVEAIIYDISNRTNPIVTRTIRVEGDFLGSRLINGNLYFIVGFFPGSRYGIGFVAYPTDATATVLPERLIPLMYDSARSSEGTVPIASPEDIGYVSNVYAQQLISIAAVDVRDRTATPAPIGKAVAAVKGSVVMVSPYNIYLATSDYTDGSPNTVVARFEIAGPKVVFRSLGQVEGILLNQFSLDEHEGQLRLATTRYTSGWRIRDNCVWVLNSDMSIAGQLTEIAPGERIYSSRFYGSVAYLVTFLQTDPLFTIGLTDPSKPQILGELKVPGVSDYLHMASEEKKVLIGVGRAQRPDSTALYGTKISTFDVSSLIDPFEISSYSVVPQANEEWVWSDIINDHHAFFFNKGLLAVPLTTQNYTDRTKDFIGSLVLSVGTDWRLRLKGRISHQDVRYLSQSDYVYRESIKIKRQLFINELLYTVSNNVIEAHQLSTLDKSLRMVVAQRNVTLDPNYVYLY